MLRHVGREVCESALARLDAPEGQSTEAEAVVEGGQVDRRERVRRDVRFALPGAQRLDEGPVALHLARQLRDGQQRAGEDGQRRHGARVGRSARDREETWAIAQVSKG